MQSPIFSTSPHANQRSERTDGTGSSIAEATADGVLMVAHFCADIVIQVIVRA
jgi:hypothetical protein